MSTQDQPYIYEGGIEEPPIEQLLELERGGVLSVICGRRLTQEETLREAELVAQKRGDPPD
ncbi:TPA: hypothetical protein DCQ44_03345 [Candidatus Taylorbacteria bacterium]|nr:hypothetical protein [Candidatus Taylorbacteria bacterium]